MKEKLFRHIYTEREVFYIIANVYFVNALIDPRMQPSVHDTGAFVSAFSM